MSTAQKSHQLTGRSVLIIFIGFFLVVFAANGIMTFLAIDTFSGIETEDAYRKGRDYNQVIEEGRAQEALSWQAVMNAQSLGNSRLGIGINVLGKDGLPRQGANVALTLMRPAEQGKDVIVTLQETEAGVFASEIDLPEPGNWKAFVTVTLGNGEEFRLETKLFVKE